MSNCKMDFIRDVSSDLIAEFCEDDLKKIIDTITIKLNEYEMSERCTALTVVDTESQKLVKKFLATKRIEGRSPKTIDRYSYVIKRMMEYLNMPIKDMDVYSPAPLSGRNGNERIQRLYTKWDPLDHVLIFRLAA